MTKHTPLTRRLTGAQLIPIALVVLAVLVLLAGFAPVAIGQTEATAAVSAQVSQDTIYLAENDTVVARDAKTNSTLWSFQVGESIQSSPTVVDQTVYIGANDGTVYALDATDGIKQWEFAEPTDAIDAAPTIVNGTVFVGSNDNTVYAVDAADGSKQWEFTKPTDSVQYAIGVEDDIAVAITQDDAVYGIDANTGSEIWNQSSYRIRGDGTVANGSIYLPGYDNQVIALYLDNGTTQWTNTDPVDRVRSAPAVRDGRVISGTDNFDGGVIAIDADNGTTLWHRTNVGSDRYRGGTTIANGLAIVGSDDDTLRAFDVQDGSTVWSHSAGGDIRSTPTVAKDYVYYASENGQLYRLNVSDGSEQYAKSVASPTSPTFVSNGNTRSDGSRVQLKTLGHHDFSIFNSAAVKVTVQSESGELIDGADVEITAQDGTQLATGTTTDGTVSLVPSTQTAEDIDITAEAKGVTDTETIFYDPNGSDQSTTITLDIQSEQFLELEIKPQLLNHSETAEYAVFYNNESGRFDVTDEANINNTNTTVVTLDTANNRITATSDENISARVIIEANWTSPDNTEYTTENYVVVSEGNLEDIFILPPVWRFNAFLSNGNILSILVGTLAGIVGARWANSFAGVGLFVLVMLVGWFAGYATTGIMLVAVFVGAWLGLNLAANIDYTVRQ